MKWRESWEPEERLMAACEGALQVFWKEYYANVEQEIRKQVVCTSDSLISVWQLGDKGQGFLTFGRYGGTKSFVWAEGGEFHG